MIPLLNNTRNNEERFRTEIWDQMQFFFQEYNDHQLHGVIYFKDLLDFECLKKAVFLSMDAVPLLGSRFILNNFRPFWARVSHLNEQDIITIIEAINPDEEINAFLTEITNELTGPQLKVRVIRCFGQDVLCLVMNHMVCDGAGFKEYLYLLARLYTQLEQTSNHNSEFRNGSRSSAQIYRQFGLLTRVKLFFLPNEPLQNKNNVYFPLSKETSTPLPHILIHKLPPERFQRLKKYSKEHAVTVNDIILAAYYRALYQTVEISKDDSLTIPCMVDLRRYLPQSRADGICNLSSMIMCNIGPELGDSLEETIIKVKRAMNKKKAEFPGLHGVATLNLLFKLLPFSLIRKIIKEKYVNPLIGITNIGIIDYRQLTFGSLAVDDAFVTGSIKYPPYFQLAFSSFRDSLTFTINLYAFSKDIATIKKFFILLEDELNTL